MTSTSTMGGRAFDQFSLLHVASGVVAYFWGVSFVTWFAAHLAFEVVENTGWGMALINRYITVWPGGKPHRDSNANILGDQLSGSLGWILAALLDQGARFRWTGRARTAPR